jgi:hypothetical protein
MTVTDETSTKSSTTSVEQRGKRKLSRQIELLLLVLILTSVGGIDSAYDVLKTILPYSVGLIVALRGLDAHYHPKRL